MVKQSSSLVGTVVYRINRRGGGAALLLSIALGGISAYAPRPALAEPPALTTTKDNEAFDRGNAAMDAGKSREALAAFQEADRLRPGYGPTLYGLGRASYALKEYQQAKAYLERAESAMPSVNDANDAAARRAMVLELLSYTEFQLGEEDAARRHISEARTLDPTNSDIQNGYAKLHAEE